MRGIWAGNGGGMMARKRHTPEQIINRPGRRLALGLGSRTCRLSVWLRDCASGAGDRARTHRSAPCGMTRASATTYLRPVGRLPPIRVVVSSFSLARCASVRTCCSAGSQVDLHSDIAICTAARSSPRGDAPASVRPRPCSPRHRFRGNPSARTSSAPACR
jgi:hypothetical protein